MAWFHIHCCLGGKKRVPEVNPFLINNTMASGFIGLSVKVLLTSGVSLKGHVADVDSTTQRLMLQDGKHTHTHSLSFLCRRMKALCFSISCLLVVIHNEDDSTVKVIPSFSVPGGEIKDLQVLPTHIPAHPQPQKEPYLLTTSATASPTHHTIIGTPAQIQLQSHSQSSAMAANSTNGPNMPFHDPAIITASRSNAPFHDPAIISVRAHAHYLYGSSFL